MSTTEVVFSGDGVSLSAAEIGAQITALAAAGSIESDAYSIGGSVAALENAAASMLGKEAGLWTPTGTMANLLGIFAHCDHSAPRVILPQESHIYHDTGDGVSRLLSLTPVPLGAGKPCYTAADARTAIEDGRVGGRVKSAVGALVVESPVRRRQGEIVSLEEIKKITDVARAAGVGCHLDGARLHMMANSTGIDVKEYASLFDTVYLDCHKYFGAPWGALLLGPAALVKPLFHERRMLGGACTNAALAAAMALEGMKSFPRESAAAMDMAKALIPKLDTLDGLALIVPMTKCSNIFTFRVTDQAAATEAGRVRFTKSLKRSNIRISTGTASYGQEPSAGDQQQWPQFPLTINPSLLRSDNASVVEAFRIALQDACRAEGPKL